MKPITKKLISLGIVLILLAFAIHYLITNIEHFRQISLEKPYLIIPLVIIFIVNYILFGLSTIYLLQPLKVKIGLIEGFEVAIINGFYNLITPFRGGMAAKAVYLKEKHNFSYTKFLASVAASYVIVFLIASFLGMIATYLIYLETGGFSTLLFFIFLFFFVPLLVIVIFSPTFPETKNSFINKFITVMNGWNLIKHDKKAVFLVSILSLAQLLLSSLSTYLSFRVFGIEISFISSLFLSCVGSLGILISLTPAGLGVSEAITIFSALTIGISATQSLPVALLGRVVQIIVLFILGPIFSYVLLRKKPKSMKNVK